MKQQHPQAKRTRSWREYNHALVQRGSLTLWVTPEICAAWKQTTHPARRGARQFYSGLAIMTMASLKAIYHLRLRQTEGLMVSIASLLGVDLPVPDFSTLCRRLQRLQVPINAHRSGKPIHLVVDSTGVKLYGDGEWMRLRHPRSRNRRWRKLHLGIDEATQQVMAAAVSDNSVTDAQMFEPLLDQVDDPIEQISGDGAYDKRGCYQVARARNARASIPPQKRAKIWVHGNTRGERHARDENLRYIRKHGRAAWKKHIGYHRRSLAETAMSRMKTIFGDRLRARRIDTQTAELLIRVRLLNQMRQLTDPVVVPAI